MSSREQPPSSSMANENRDGEGMNESEPRRIGARALRSQGSQQGRRGTSGSQLWLPGVRALQGSQFAGRWFPRLAEPGGGSNAARVRLAGLRKGTRLRNRRTNEGGSKSASIIRMGALRRPQAPFLAAVRLLLVRQTGGFMAGYGRKRARRSSERVRAPSRASFARAAAAKSDEPQAGDRHRPLRSPSRGRESPAQEVILEKEVNEPDRRCGGLARRPTGFFYGWMMIPASQDLPSRTWSVFQ